MEDFHSFYKTHFMICYDNGEGRRTHKEINQNLKREHFLKISPIYSSVIQCMYFDSRHSRFLIEKTFILQLLHFKSIFFETSGFFFIYFQFVKWVQSGIIANSTYCEICCFQYICLNTLKVFFFWTNCQLSVTVQNRWS